MGTRSVKLLTHLTKKKLRGLAKSRATILYHICIAKKAKDPARLHHWEKAPCSQQPRSVTACQRQSSVVDGLNDPYQHVGPILSPLTN